MAIEASVVQYPPKIDQACVVLENNVPVAVDSPNLLLPAGDAAVELENPEIAACLSGYRCAYH
jgi:hypothetical protein